MQGYSGSYDTVKKFVASIREEQPGPTCVRFETEPGEQAQVDWSPAGKPEWGGKKVKLWCFSMVLGYSRAMYIEFTHRSGGYLYYFSELDCSVCPLKEGYLKNTQTRKRIYLRPEVFTYRLCSIKRAMRIRKTIERVFGEVKTWHCLYRARYRGLARVTVQVLLTFLVVNAKKMATGLAARGSVCACQP